MNLIQLYASSAMIQCRKFTAFLISSLREAVFTAQTSSYAHLWISRVRHALNAGVIHIFDSTDILQARALKGAHTAPLKRVALGVAVGLVGALCLPMGHADSGSIEAIDPKRYVRLALPKKEAICLSKLIGKESAWNHQAIGNLSSPTKSYVYGLLQLKNPIVKDKSPIEQIHFGLKYIDHRYQGNACNAWKHWKDKGWH
jgi:hypothetical protein